MQINIKLDSEVYDLLEAYPERINVATQRAINRSLKGINTDGSKSITSRYNVKKKDISLGVKINKYTKSTLKGSVDFGGRPIELHKFKTFPSKYSKRKPAIGIGVEIRKGKKTLFRSSFMNRAGIIFKRETKARLPIKKLYGPRISQMINKSSRLIIVKKAEERLLTNFKHELRLGARYS